MGKEDKQPIVEVTSLLGETLRIPKEVVDNAKEALSGDKGKDLLFVLKAIAVGSNFNLPDALKSGFDTNKLFYIQGIKATIHVIEALHDRTN